MDVNESNTIQDLLYVYRCYFNNGQSSFRKGAEWFSSFQTVLRSLFFWIICLMSAFPVRSFGFRRCWTVHFPNLYFSTLYIFGTSLIKTKQNTLLPLRSDKSLISVENSATKLDYTSMNICAEAILSIRS